MRFSRHQMPSHSLKRPGRRHCEDFELTISDPHILVLLARPQYSPPSLSCVFAVLFVCRPDFRQSAVFAKHGAITLHMLIPCDPWTELISPIV